MEKFWRNDKFAFMKELFGCGTNIFLWQYDTDGHILHTSSDQLVLDKFFEHSGSKSYMLEHARQYTSPLILGTHMGMVWCAVFEYKEENPYTIYVLGPVLNSEISTKTVEKSARAFHVDLIWREGFIHLIQSLPVLSSILFLQYALMLHYCVTGEKLNRSDLHFQKKISLVSEDTDEEKPIHDRTQVWLAEQRLLHMVRQGNMNYHNAINYANLLSDGTHISGHDPILQAIVSCTTFTSLCTREAIRAGLSPETAYSVGDNYIQSMVNCKTISELQTVNHTMYEDFIMRVHKYLSNPKVSRQIQNCRDYIDLHAESVLSLDILSARVGYSEYHLSRKFKQETGVSISAYIKTARIDRAKLLLKTTTLPISQIAIKLQFCSSSHFASVFRTMTGQSPLEYRESS